LSINAEPKKQYLRALFNYSSKLVNTSVNATLPLHKRIFDFVEAAQEVKDISVNVLEKQRIEFTSRTVLKPFEDRDLFLGASFFFKIPETKLSIDIDKDVKQEKEPFYHELSFLASKKTSTSETGLFIRKTYERKLANDEDKVKIGIFSVAEIDNFTLGSRCGYDVVQVVDDESKNYNEFDISSFASWKFKDSSVTLKVQVVPSTAILLGFKKKIH